MWLYFLLASMPISDAVRQPVGISYEIAGFIKQDAAGAVYLVSQPDVKSCCLGKESEAEIRLEGLTVLGSPPVRAVTVKGILERDQGKLVLKQGRILEQTSSLGALFSLIVGGAVVIYVLQRLVRA